MFTVDENCLYFCLSMYVSLKQTGSKTDIAVNFLSVLCIPWKVLQNVHKWKKNAEKFQNEKLLDYKSNWEIKMKLSQSSCLQSRKYYWISVKIYLDL